MDEKTFFEFGFVEPDGTPHQEFPGVPLWPGGCIFAYRGTSIGNNLDNDIEQCVSLQSFKQAIKGQLLEQVFS